jgi:uncharacterized protein YaiI (UPF0178 family)
MTIWADGDSLQAEIRALLERRVAAERSRAAGAGRELALRLVVVAAKPLRGGGVAEFLLVPEGPDAADEAMLAEARPGDLAVTRDLPLAERLALAGITVLNDRGESFSADAARERRSLRDRAAELRALGLAPESPRARSWGARELKAFADAFDRELRRSLPR